MELAAVTGGPELGAKILERLETNSSWREKRVNLPALQKAVIEAQKAVRFGGKRCVTSDCVKRLMHALALTQPNDSFQDVPPSMLTHEQAVRILVDRITNEPSMGPRVAALLKRHVFDDALIRQKELALWDINEIKHNIEFAKRDQRAKPRDFLSPSVSHSQIELFRMELHQWKSAHSNDQRTLAGTRIEECFENNAMELNLSNLRLTTLPGCIWQLSWLKNLDLSSNRFESLPSFIGHLQNLETLNASSNRLTRLPDELNWLPSTCSIDLTNNRYSGLISEIFRLNSMKPDGGPTFHDNQQWRPGNDRPKASERQPPGKSMEQSVRAKHCKMLRVPLNPDQQTIRDAYLKFSKKFHPDKNPDDKKAAEERFKIIKEAYEVLLTKGNDPAKESEWQHPGKSMEQSERAKCCEILCVPLDADEETIRKTFNDFSLIYDPKVNPNDPKAEKEFKEIKEAYQILVPDSLPAHMSMNPGGWPDILRKRAMATGERSGKSI